MRILTVSLVFLGLAACDVAGPGFYDAQKTVVTVEESTFTLRRQGDMIESIRTNMEIFPLFKDVGRKAGIAAERWTGCKAAWIVGDPSVQRIGLSCDGRDAPPEPREKAVLRCRINHDIYYDTELECYKQD